MNLDIVLFLTGMAFFLLSSDLVKLPVLAKRSAWLRALVLLGFFALLHLMLHSEPSGNATEVLAHRALG